MQKTRKKEATSNVGFEETLWATADKMRNNMDPAEYKHVVLGLIFLKYISDSFEEVCKQIMLTRIIMKVRKKTRMPISARACFGYRKKHDGNI